jgi:hypothetical protein
MAKTIWITNNIDLCQPFMLVFENNEVVLGRDLENNYAVFNKELVTIVDNSEKELMQTYCNFYRAELAKLQEKTANDFSTKKKLVQSQIDSFEVWAEKL